MVKITDCQFIVTSNLESQSKRKVEEPFDHQAKRALGLWLNDCSTFSPYLVQHTIKQLTSSPLDNNEIKICDDHFILIPGLHKGQCQIGELKNQKTVLYDHDDHAGQYKNMSSSILG